jgi:hypothetical protein
MQQICDVLFFVLFCFFLTLITLNKRDLFISIYHNMSEDVWELEINVYIACFANNSLHLKIYYGTCLPKLANRL